MNTKNIPAIIMLAAGFVAAATMIKQGTSTDKYLITLLEVLVIFYILGIVVKFILDKFIKMEDPEESEETEGEESEEESLEDIPIVEGEEDAGNAPNLDLDDN